MGRSSPLLMPAPRTSILAISYLVRDYDVYGYVMLLVRIPFDVYPIMLQRWNRGRVCRVVKCQRGQAL